VSPFDRIDDEDDPGPGESYVPDDDEAILAWGLAGFGMMVVVAVILALLMMGKPK
jgi:hypothetical protein